MTDTANVTLVRRWFEQGLTSPSLEGTYTLAAEVFADKFVDHDGVGHALSSRAAWLKAVVDPVRAAFSDIDVEVVLAFGSDDLVSVRYLFFGTHSGTFAGVPPTRRRIRHSENEIYRLENGQGSWRAGARATGWARCASSARYRDRLEPEARRHPWREVAGCVLSVHEVGADWCSLVIGQPATAHRSAKVSRTRRPALNLETWLSMFTDQILADSLAAKPRPRSWNLIPNPFSTRPLT